MPTTNSNIILYATSQGIYVNTRLASGLALNSDTQVAVGQTNGSLITDILFRNLNTTTAVLFDIIVVPSGGSSTSAQLNIAQVSVPANSGNNGSTAIASLAALIPSLFDIDLAGNRVMTLESGASIYVRNKAALTSDIIVMAKRRDY